MTRGVVFNVQRCSIHDGPGVRTTVFLKGCPLRCAWCHNPESWDPGQTMLLRDDRCLACGACVEACPVGVATPVTRTGPQTADRCLLCGDCATACPGEARAALGRTIAVDDLLREVLRDAPFYGCEGGVTVSGGEPLAAAHTDFTLEFLAACRRAGLSTAVDTCGHVDPAALAAAAELTDLVLYDLKLMDPDRHLAATGVDNGRILANLRALSSGRSEIWVRVPLVPGVNDDDENLDALAAFVAGLPRRHPVHILPYHRNARDKFARLGLDFTLTGAPHHSQEQLQAAAARLQGHDVTVVHGG